MEQEGKYETKVQHHQDVKKINTDSFQEFTQSLSDTYQNNLCLRFFENSWNDSSFKDFANSIFKYARFFTKKNIANKNVLILSESRPEVLELYFSSFAANVVSTPIDIKLSPREVAYIINEVQPEIVFVTSKQYPLLKQASDHIDFDLNIIAINHIDKHYSLSDIPENKEIELPKEDTTKTGMIIYTSGSTGNMKGVETSGSQLLFQAHALLRVGFAAKPERNLSMLPMNHLFEVSGTISSISAGFSICISHGLEKEDLGMCFQKHHPTQIFSVPLFCKSIMSGIKLSIADSPLPKRLVFKVLTFLATICPSMKMRQKIFAPVHQKFGGSLHRLIVGGAAADIPVIKFFNLLGINIYEGYGLTETAPVIAVNRVSIGKPGSVGPLIPGVKVKIEGKSGEIYTKGPHIMRGYYKNTDATSEVLSSDGWFKTGDIGHFDNEGLLYITGRSKNLIILENGKKVHPEEVQKAFEDIEFIKEVSIFGDRSKKSSNSQNIVFIAHLDDNFTSKHGEQSLSLLTSAIEKRSDRIASYKLPSKILLSKEELPKTTTMKVKHFVVAKKYEEGKYS